MKRESPFYSETKAMLNQAFSALRKQGFVTRQNFMCCGGCAASELASEEKIDGKACVHYNKQRAEGLKESGFVWVDWGVVRGENALSVAARAVEAFKAAGLKVFWEGGVNNGILVGSEKAIKAYVERCEKFGWDSKDYKAALE